MQPPPPLRNKLHFFLFVVAAILLGANAVAMSELDSFGVPLLFAGAALWEVILLVFLINEALLLLRGPWKIIASLLKSAGEGLAKNSYLVNFQKAHPHAWTWLANRCSLKRADGLALTVGILIALGLFVLFLSIVEDVILKETLVAADQRILNLMPSLRTPGETAFFRWATFLGTWESVVLMVGLVLFILLRKKQNFTAMLFLLTVGLGEGITYVLKTMVGRLRPDQSLSLVTEGTFSFPSGHTMSAVLLFGTLTYLIFRSLKHSLSKIGLLLGGIGSMVLVALSRIYLGAHYPSDVLASMTLGATLLALFVTLEEIQRHYHPFHQKNLSSLKSLLMVPLVMGLLSLGLSPRLVHLKAITPEASTSLSEWSPAEIQALPLYSETLTGRRMEPVSFIYVGTQEQIENLFVSHGWFKAEPLTANSLMKALFFVSRNEPYATGPVTPSYVNARPNDLAFEQATSSNSFRERHHTRLWKTNFVDATGRPIWVATASLDTGIEWSPVLVPTHHIDPNIDAERDYIVQSLELSQTEMVQVVDAQMGTNSAGDGFFTDGKAVVVEL